MFNIGDKVVCKLNEDNFFGFKYVHIYSITGICCDKKYRRFEDIIEVDDVSFRKYSIDGRYNFDDYFITLKEARKLKLDKLTNKLCLK